MQSRLSTRAKRGFIHNKAGNIALADGGAHQSTTPVFNQQFQAALVSTTQAVHRLALPE